MQIVYVFLCVIEHLFAVCSFPIMSKVVGMRVHSCTFHTETKSTLPEITIIRMIRSKLKKKIYYLTYRIMWTRWEFSNESNSVNFVFVFSFFSLFVSIKIGSLLFGLTERTPTKALKNFTLFFLSSFLILHSFRHFALSRPISHFTSHFDQ